MLQFAALCQVQHEPSGNEVEAGQPHGLACLDLLIYALSVGISGQII